jgi:membrane-associated phospholipid phosphatase
MTPADYVIHLTLSIVLIVGVYQFYFWCQRHQLVRPRELKLAIDEWIPYQPHWVWIYSFLYYPLILYANLIVQSPGHFTHLAISYLLLLGFQMPFFLLFPVATPEDWRKCNRQRSYSERFLAFVQKFDKSSNSFPSMHTSVATLTALHLYPSLGVGSWSFPVLIGLSCLFTKQHYLIDLPAGAALGWFVFYIFGMIG